MDLRDIPLEMLNATELEVFVRGRWQRALVQNTPTVGVDGGRVAFVVWVPDESSEFLITRLRDVRLPG